MRAVEPGEIPRDGGTAIQDIPGRPVFRGQGSDDYICAVCDTVLATAMPPEYMNRKLRIRCAQCRTVNAGIEVEGVDYAAAFGRRGVGGAGSR